LFESDFELLNSEFGDWNDRDICLSALNKHATPPKRSVNSDNCLAISEPKQRALTLEDCAVIKIISAENFEKLNAFARKTDRDQETVKGWPD